MGSLMGYLGWGVLPAGRPSARLDKGDFRKGGGRGPERLRTGAGGGGSHDDPVSARMVDLPSVLVELREGLRREDELDLGRGASRNGDLLEVDQGRERGVRPTAGGPDVALHGLLYGAAAGVRQARAQRDRAARREGGGAQPQGTVPGLPIAEPEAERVERLPRCEAVGAAPHGIVVERGEV